MEEKMEATIYGFTGDLKKKNNNSSSSGDDKKAWLMNQRRTPSPGSGFIAA